VGSDRNIWQTKAQVRHILALPITLLIKNERYSLPNRQLFSW